MATLYAHKSDAIDAPNMWYTDPVAGDNVPWGAITSIDVLEANGYTVSITADATGFEVATLQNTAGGKFTIAGQTVEFTADFIQKKYINGTVI